MANSILGSHGQSMQPKSSQGAQVPAGNNPMQMLQQFQQFKKNFQGNPQQMVQQMLQSGQINNAQLQQAMQMARQFRQFIK